MQAIKSGPVGISARFSTDLQDERSIEDQVRRCREYVRQQGGDADRAQVFPDFTKSGASPERPGFEAMMAAVDSGRIKVIVTEDMSRISRDFADSALTFKRLQFLQVPLIGVADGIDTSSKPAKLSFTVKSLVADLGSKHKCFGWGASTIRAILYNERYAGVWRFKERQWVKVPGTNRRQPQPRNPADVMTMERPELRIIEASVWTEVQARLAAVHRNYTKRKREGGIVRKPTTYLLSGVLHCAQCAAPMSISAGTSASYYRCQGNRKKSTCPNRVSVREVVARRAGQPPAPPGQQRRSHGGRHGPRGIPDR